MRYILMQRSVAALSAVLFAATLAFALAQSFNAFYNLPPGRSSILNEERDAARRWRAAGVIYVRNQLVRALDLMGMSVPVRM